MTRKELKAQAIAAGRKHLAEWFAVAQKHGTIYYNITSVSRSGMNRKIRLYTIRNDETCDGNPVLWKLWPYAEAIEEWSCRDYKTQLDDIARDWSFSFQARAFNVSGCGMDMVLHLVYSLLSKSGIDEPLNVANAIRLESI